MYKKKAIHFGHGNFVFSVNNYLGCIIGLRLHNFMTIVSFLLLIED